MGFSILDSEQGTASRRFFYSATFWLIVPGLLGVFLAAVLYVPSLYDRLPLVLKPYFSFGRLRPTHVNLAIFGWLSQYLRWYGYAFQTTYLHRAARTVTVKPSPLVQ